MSSVQTRHLETIPSLDGLRAVSVLFVVVAHSGFGNIVPGGFGVTVFFFLSGYLITTLMLAEFKGSGRIDIVSFYIRRCFRLYPPLLVTLVIAYSLVAIGYLPGGITVKGLLSQLLYFANYYGIFFDTGNTIPAGTGILWSLAVEEHFYIFYPMIMGVLLRRSLRPAVIGVILSIFCVLVLVWRIHLVQAEGFVPERTYYASDTRIDSIIYGCLLAVAANPLRHLGKTEDMSSRQWVLLSAAVGVVLMTFIYRDPFFRETIRYSLQGMALLPIFYFAVRFHNNFVFRHLNSFWMMKLGIWSYAVYLIHQIIIYLIGANAPALSALPLLLLLVVLGISMAFAAAVDSLVDPYFRKLRRRYRSSTVAVA